jgi:hypothetical protein
MLLTLLLTTATAKDLHGTLGLGFDSHVGDGAALSARYWLPLGKAAPNIGVQAVLGLDTTAATPDWATGGRALYGFVEEDNMTLYAAVGAYALGARRALRLQPAIGAEFFLFGLEHLGISAQWSLDMDVGQTSDVATRGSGAAAVHYYF